MHGFRAGHLTPHQLLGVIEHITEGFNTNKHVLLLDVNKAFDKVWHDGFVHKMHFLGFTIKLI